MRKTGTIVMVIALIGIIFVLGTQLRKSLKMEQIVGIEVVSRGDEAFLMAGVVTFEWDYSLSRWAAEWFWERLSRLHAVIPTSRESRCDVWHIDSVRSVRLEAPLHCFDAVIPVGGEVYFRGKGGAKWKWTGDALALAAEAERQVLNEEMGQRSMSVDGTEWTRKSSLLPQKDGLTEENFGSERGSWSLEVKRRGFVNAGTDRGEVSIDVTRKGQAEELLRIEERHQGS